MPRGWPHVRECAECGYPIAALDAAEDGLGTNCDGCRDRIADAFRQQLCRGCWWTFRAPGTGASTIDIRKSMQR